MKSKIQQILRPKELSLIKRLNTPIKIQNYLDKIPFNFQKKGQTYFSPRRMLEEQKAHCLEGALFAYLCLFYHNHESYIVDLKVKKSAKADSDHIITLFAIKKRDGKKTKKTWGAISKTNHSVLRYRDPIYKSPGEVARSYFHEYFLNDGEKTLDSYSKPLNIFGKFGISWITEGDHLHDIAEWIDDRIHFKFVPQEARRMIRKAGKTEIKGAAMAEWDYNGKML